jgi:pimeloyl-ACP methyl ester carboxylesterase
VTAQPLPIAGPSPDGASWPTWHTAAWLTLPIAPRRDELQILLHGAAYDHRYWDWRVEPARYSYALWAAEHGVATLAVDRIGNGTSTRPPGVENTVAAQAEVVHQLVIAARRGLPGAPSFRRVVLVGHSLGSVIGGYEAATYGDADAVVLTGYLPTASRAPRNHKLVDAGFVPALERFPHLRGLVDDDYLAPVAGGRARVMYHLDQADPAIVAVDEQLTGTATRGELGDAGAASAVIRSSATPTLVVVGQHDRFIGARRSGDDGYALASKCAVDAPAHFDFEVVAATGHCVNQHRTAHECYETIDRWLTAGEGATA